MYACSIVILLFVLVEIALLQISREALHEPYNHYPALHALRPAA
jgi:hypothetical protein